MNVLQYRSKIHDGTWMFLPGVYIGGLMDTTDEMLETLLRAVVTGHRLI